MSRISVLFSLWVLQGLIALAWLALLPTDAQQGSMFGFSSSRLLLLAILLVLTAFSTVMLWFSRRTAFTLRPAQSDILLLFCITAAFLAPAVILALRALGQTSGFVYTAYADRLAPLAFWFTLASIEFVLWRASVDRDEITLALKPARPFFLVSSYFFLALAVLAILILITRVGLTPYNDGSWGWPATPLLEWQILLALAVGLISIVPVARFSKLQLSDSRMAVFVYLLTCAIWLSQPVNPGFFATPPRAPNFEIYPFSDAQIYAQYAQSALVGNGFLWPDVPTRPLYVTFLTWLHALAGQDYTRVVVLQTLVLAAFPAVLYLLGSELGGRPLGLGLALLAALRDLTANIAAPFALNHTYSKLFFSEMPAALLISLFTLMAIRWMRDPQKPAWYALLAGGVLGLSALIRLQSAFVLIAVIPISFFVLHNRRKWALGSALMLAGLALALLPWLSRNYLATGGLVLDNPTSQAMVLARRWSGDSGNDLLPTRPGEGAAQYSSRMLGLAIESLRRDPGRVLGSAGNHFFNNEIGNLLVFPVRDRLDSPGELIWPEHAFWQSKDSPPGSMQMLLVGFYLVLFSLGLGAAWYKNGLPGLLPLGISLAYNAWTALFLSSGDRFLVPVDWAVYLYHFLGLLTLAGLLLSVLQKARGNVSAWIFARHNGGTPDPESLPVSWRRPVVLTAALVLFLGASIPLTEAVFPRVAAQATHHNPQGEVTLYGRAIYPRYYAAGEGEPGTAKMGYGVSDEARLVFYLLGEQNTLVIFPLEHAPAFFPNASQVAVSGTQEEGFIRAQNITVAKDGKSAEVVP